MVAKSAAQIVHEQNGNMAPAARLAMTRRVHPLVSLNPYQGNWTIKVRVTNKENMRTYKNARGEGCVFNVELTDEDGTQIQATMFNEATRKFYDRFQLGKVYYISRGTLRVANKQFKTVQNDYEMNLNENLRWKKLLMKQHSILKQNLTLYLFMSWGLMSMGLNLLISLESFKMFLQQ